MAGTMATNSDNGSNQVCHGTISVVASPFVVLPTSL
jgi:hypothetical protein